MRSVRGLAASPVGRPFRDGLVSAVGRPFRDGFVSPVGRPFRGAIVVALSLAMSGCGYALAGRGSFLPADIRVVGIPLLENRTPIALLDQRITEKVRDEFIRRGKYQVDSSASGVDAVLSGAITNLAINEAGLDQQRASRYEIIVTMRVQFTDTRTNQVLWSNEALTFRDQYDLRSRSGGQVDGTVLLEQEGPAFDRLATDLARSVVTSILEAF